MCPERNVRAYSIMRNNYNMYNDICALGKHGVSPHKICEIMRKYFALDGINLDQTSTLDWEELCDWWLSDEDEEEEDEDEEEG